MNLSALSRHGAVILVLVVYGALLAFQFNHGLASGDGHGIVRTVQTLLNRGQVEVSRPPGHPVTELYLFGAIGWVLRNVFSTDFGDETYLVCQAVAALLTLIVFYELLIRLGVNRFRSVLATICLAFSAQFFFNSVDGEEFVFGLLFLLISVRFLVACDSQGIFALSLSIFCFAFATGCRPELVFAAILFPIFCQFHSKLGWKYALVTIPFAALAIFVVWLPIVFVGIREPYTAGMNLRESILGGIYRVVFQAFTLPVLLLLCWVLITALFRLQTQIDSRNFVFTISCVLPMVFIAVFFLHPSKAAHLLVVLPFLLVLAVGRSLALLLALTLLTLLGSMASLDIFKDRQLARPYFTSGSYFQAVRQKPYYKLNYLREISNQCESRPSVIIGNAWPWDFEYHIERNNSSLREKELHGKIKRNIPEFFSSGEHCIFLPPDAAYESALLAEWHQKGYEMKMDATLYRTLFARYDLRSAPGAGAAEIGGVPFNLFRVQ
jgi:hypothetical protein